jgi:hypothetical protein
MVLPSDRSTLRVSSETYTLFAVDASIRTAKVAIPSRHQLFAVCLYELVHSAYLCTVEASASLQSYRISPELTDLAVSFNMDVRWPSRSPASKKNLYGPTRKTVGNSRNPRCEKGPPKTACKTDSSRNCRSKAILSNRVPPRSSCRSPSASRRQSHSSAKLLSTLLEGRRESFAIRYMIFRQSPNHPIFESCYSRITHQSDLRAHRHPVE